jgi:nucleoprotein TPR
MKLRLKDTQLIRSQNRVKELEKQIDEWKKAGVITSQTATEPASAPAASPPVPAAPSASASAPSPTTYCPTPWTPSGECYAGIPRKPPGANTAAGTATGQPVRGRGRGACGETLASAAPLRLASVVEPSHLTAPGGGAGAGATAGVAIMGAASKRTREEGEASTEDSLSKRLKPATAATATTATADGYCGRCAGGAAAGGNTGGKPSPCSAIVSSLHDKMAAIIHLISFFC